MLQAIIPSFASRRLRPCWYRQPEPGQLRCRARLRPYDDGNLYRQGMADRRSALDKHLGITEHDSAMPWSRLQALTEHVGQALNSQNYAAAQVYALLIIAERQDTGSVVEVQLTNWEDLAIAIGTNIAHDLERITDAIDRLDR